MEQLWDHPACPTTLKKRILRTVLKEIIATEVGDPAQIFLKLHWAGGAHTELVLRKNQTGHHNRVNSREVIDLVRELGQVCDDAAIVGILNRLGYRQGPRTRGMRSGCNMCATAMASPRARRRRSGIG